MAGPPPGIEVDKLRLIEKPHEPTPGASRGSAVLENRSRLVRGKRQNRRTTKGAISAEDAATRTMAKETISLDRWSESRAGKLGASEWRGPRRQKHASGARIRARRRCLKESGEITERRGLRSRTIAPRPAVRRVLQPALKSARREARRAAGGVDHAGGGR
jgi:hypothetical protein